MLAKKSVEEECFVSNRTRAADLEVGLLGKTGVVGVEEKGDTTVVGRCFRNTWWLLIRIP